MWAWNLNFDSLDCTNIASGDKCAFLHAFVHVFRVRTPTDARVCVSCSFKIEPRSPK